ncbi:DNA-processing protein DprA [Paenibacillus arenilitoris]|uniref:DNA-protecting protein DprA n=1 Tax=Paenibacillus arenilitoris TaxID=2772299 RepID=A0A927H6N5_9BACL|nr:DNA-processing protein DprA [Paenibacillus arenilitoris]MBD2870751.1 DNA-protecting protein DprA [Paenibacillus arenilitoris]
MTANHHMRKQMIVALHEIPGIGWQAIHKAVSHRLWEKPIWKTDDLTAIGMRGAQAKAASERYAGRTWMSEADRADNVGGHTAVLTPFDSEYPQALKEIAQPPWVLYARGRLELLERPAIAVVGTRVPTAYGRHSATSLARELSAAGLTVVSGLARGIDGKAHEAALYGRGGTIAVLPTPIDRCYPPENVSLFHKIAEHGLLVSETPLGTPLHPGQFPLRNRIIAGLTFGTVVVEGARRSGSLITAQQAMEMNREVFAVPGPISSPKSEGPNDLIKRGEAKLIGCVNDIVEELAWLPAALRRLDLDESGEAGGPAGNEAALNEEERKIIALLRDQPLSINELHELSSIPFGHLNALLLNLCIKRKIELQSGSIYMAL